METRPVRDAHQVKLCVYSIPCDCGRWQISETSRPLEVCTKEHKYNLTQGLLEKSKLAQYTVTDLLKPRPTIGLWAHGGACLAQLYLRSVLRNSV
jgi:hypothetical protein